MSGLGDAREDRGWSLTSTYAGGRTNPMARLCPCSDEILPTTPCGDSDCCGLEVLSNDHTSGTTGEYFNFNANFDCQAPTVTFEVAQYRAGAQIWSGPVTFWHSVNGGSSGDSHGRREGGQAPDQFEAGDFLCVLTCAGGTGR
jgi:hypothetical protein